jgi:uncharacterized protein
MDVRGGVASLSEAERAELGDTELPAFAQVWALGFMFAVENWPAGMGGAARQEAGQDPRRGTGRHRRADRGR